MFQSLHCCRVNKALAVPSVTPCRCNAKDQKPTELQWNLWLHIFIKHLETGVNNSAQVYR